jgi:protein pelota
LKLLARDDEAGSVRLRLDSLDDLWHLRELVEPGDLATALTWRTADVDRKDERAKVEKRATTLTIRVETIEYQAFSNRLRLLGPIVEGQDLAQYHTLAFEPGSEIALRKPKGFRPHHDARIQEAVEATARPLVTILAMEDNEAVVATLRQYGVQKMADVVGHVSGKQYAPTKGEEHAFFDEIMLALRDYRPADAPLLVLGPGFAKERFLQYARQKEPALVKGAALEATGQAGMAGVHEALKRGSVDRVSKDQRVAREAVLVERLMEAIGKDEPATYGAAETRRALEAGAVDVLLVADHLVREGAGEALLDLARGMGSAAVIVSTLHEAGKRLDALGGVGALLRYRL